MAYHVPVGEEPYLSVAFSVDGPIQGLHGDTFVEHAQYQFGQLLAGWGSVQKLVSGIQTVTRVIPADSAAHEVWLQEHLDPDAPSICRPTTRNCWTRCPRSPLCTGISW